MQTNSTYGFWARFKAFFRKLEIRFVLISAFSSLFLLVITYLIDSSPYPVGGEVTIGQWIERIEYLITGRGDNVPDSIFLINVAFDKDLVEYEEKLFAEQEDSPLLPAGKVAITDRKKLLRFLQLADSVGGYRYILLDVRFEESVTTDSVSEELFSQISKMERIVFPVHQGSETSQDAPLDKGAFGDYHTTFLVSDVVKYPLLKQVEDGNMDSSIPLRMYEELQGHKFSGKGLLTFDNGALSLRSVYPTYPVRISSWAKDADDSGNTVLQYLNLGEDLLKDANHEKKVPQRIKGKIVVIGDFIDDIHDTYYGMLPGALINLNAYIALCRGDHKISLVGTIILFLLYFALSWSIIQGRVVADYLPRRWRTGSKGKIMMVSFITYSFLLTVCGIIIYLLFGKIYSVVIPCLYFTILQSCVNLLRKS